MSIQKFIQDLHSRSSDITARLEPSISLERFIAATKDSIARDQVEGKGNLLKCSNLFSEIMKAAEDSLYPDGREGVISAYWEKDKNDKSKGRFLATWQPMIRGIHRRASELGIKVDAEVVYSKDQFEWTKGDCPSILHRPSFEKGSPVAAYAIFRDLKSGVIIHREVMSADQVEAVKSKSRYPNGMLWKDFESEAWRKTVIRRGIKYVGSIDARLLSIVSRDDALYDLSTMQETQPEQKEQKRRIPPPPPPPPPPPAKQVLTADEKIEKSIAILAKAVETGSFGTAAKVVRGSYAAMEAKEFTSEQHVRISDEFASAAAKLIAAQANEDTRNEWLSQCQDLRDESIITAGQYLEIQNQ